MTIGRNGRRQDLGAQLWSKIQEVASEMLACWCFLLHHDRMQRDFMRTAIKNYVQGRR